MSNPSSRERLEALVEQWRCEARERRSVSYMTALGTIYERCANELEALLSDLGRERPAPSAVPALIAIMNALDVHMPPAGEALLSEVRQIAASVGYPWAPEGTTEPPPPPSTELTNARLAVNDWYACSTQEELEKWRAAQQRLIRAAQADVLNASIFADAINRPTT